MRAFLFFSSLTSAHGGNISARKSKFCDSFLLYEHGIKLFKKTFTSDLTPEMVVHYDSMNRICRFKGEIPVKLLLCYHGPRKNAIFTPSY